VAWICAAPPSCAHLLDGSPFVPVTLSSKCHVSMHRRYEMGRQTANTKLSSNVSVRRVRVRGGNFKFRALRLDSGNFSWGSQAVTRKTRVLDVVYNSSNNELVGAAAMLLAVATGLRLCSWPGTGARLGAGVLSLL
jgi:ribosomal protein eS8